MIFSSEIIKARQSLLQMGSDSHLKMPHTWLVSARSSSFQYNLVLLFLLHLALLSHGKRSFPSGSSTPQESGKSSCLPKLSSSLLRKNVLHKHPQSIPASLGAELFGPCQINLLINRVFYPRQEFTTLRPNLSVVQNFQLVQSPVCCGRNVKS